MNSARNNSADTMNRRRFLARTGMIVSAGVLTRDVRFPSVPAASAAVRTEGGLADWDAVRADDSYLVLCS